MSQELRQLAREEPEAFQSFADKVGGTIRDRLLTILEEEVGDFE